MADEIEIPVLVKTPSAPDGSISGVSRFANVFSKLYRTVLTNPFVIAAIAVGAFLYKGVQSWRKQEESVNRLNTALVNQGLYTAGLSREYQNMASAIQQKTAYSDEEVLASMAQMQAFMGDKKISERLMMAVVDFAAKSGKDLSSAAEMVAKSIGTSTNMLGRYGIELDAMASKDQKIEQVIRGLESSSHGQAEAGAKGLGAVNQMWNSLNGILEATGKSLTPILIVIADAVTSLATAALKGGKYLEWIPKFIDEVNIEGKFLKAVLFQIADHLSILISSRMKAVGAVIVGDFNKAGKQIKAGDAKIADSLRQNAEEFTVAKLEILESRKKKDEAHSRELFKATEVNGEERASGNNSSQQDSDAAFKTKSDKELQEEVTKSKLIKNESFIRVNKQLQHEKNLTERHRLEVEKRKIWDEEHRNQQIKTAENLTLLSRLSNKAQINQTNAMLGHISEMNKSKLGAAVIAAKVATIAQILISLDLAIAGAWEAFASIPPPVGQIMAASFSGFLGMFAAEQIQHIIDSDIDNPGIIGNMPYDVPSLIRGINGAIGGQMTKALSDSIARLYDKTGDLIGSASAAIDQYLTDKFGVIGEAAGFTISALAKSYEWVADAMGAAAKIGSKFGDIQIAIGNAIGDAVMAIGEGIADAADFLFGWLFAEGGVVSHEGSSPIVTPLHKSGMSFRSEFNVKIVGGLVPSDREAKRIAGIIFNGRGK